MRHAVVVDIGALIVVSVSVFGANFNVGQLTTLPYGWSYWLAVVSGIMFLLNGVFMAFVSSAAHMKHKLSEVALIRKHQGESVA